MAGAQRAPTHKGAKGASNSTPGAGKRRRQGPKVVAAAAASTEESWAATTLNPPPMPEAQGRTVPKATEAAQPRKKRKASGAAKPDRAPASEPADADSSLGAVADWAWEDVAMPMHLVGGDDDVGGVMSLQEVDGIDCVWEDDKLTGGRVLKFRKGKASKKPRHRGTAAAAAARTARPAAASADPDGELVDLDDAVNWDDFVLVDDFSEEKAKSGELVSIGALMRSAEAEHDDGDDDNRAGPARDSEHDAEELASDSEGGSEGEDKDPDVDVSAWEQLGVHSDLLRALRHLGFSEPTEIQSKTLPSALQGRDVIGAAETGSGKTLAFGIPMLQHVSARQDAWSGPAGLVLTPTRELAVQVKDHLVAMARFNKARVVVIVGGMAQAKQERLLNSQPDIIVATPGRLWELASTNDAYMNQLRSIRFLAVDEADRMLERGHFKELKFIFKAVNERRAEAGDGARQTFVFSATLLKDMELTKRRLSPKAQKRNARRPQPGSMEELVERVGFQDESPAFVDVTHADATARTLTESRIDCLASDKDRYLYYILTRYPARTLVFVNSIDSIRRMLPMLRLLRVDAMGLHAQMEQRQRLKNVDRFCATENAVLVASDVAARGLDIPNVEHVIHYQVPRSGDLYVHRSGRTARAQNEGLAILMVSPEERKLYYKMCAKLSKDIAAFPVDLDLVEQLTARVDLARDIELREHKMSKRTHERNWFKKNAEELEIELDSDFMPSSDDERGAEAKRDEKQDKHQIKTLKAKLCQLLDKRVLGRGVNERYLSSSTITDLAERLTDATNFNAAIPTVHKETALEAAKRKGGKKRSA
ncbi:ATP-dependent RNA helicase [Coemansia spiralis]|nr:ATP-dependent RNA helicase [Coemansia spiralis]